MTKLQDIPSSAAHAEAIANENFATLSALAIYGLRKSATAGLSWGYYGGLYGGITVANGALSLSANSANYIVVDRGTGAISVDTSTTKWDNPTSYAKLYKVTTGPSSVTGDPEDYRAGPGGLFGAGAGGGSLSDGDYGDIVVSGGGAGINIDTAVLTPFGRTVIGAANIAAGRTALGLGTAAPLNVDSDGTLAANSDTKIATQKAVRTAINALIGANDVEVYKGPIDCSANPNYPAGDAGHVYRVSVAGKIGGASGVNVEIGDRLQCVTDGTAAGNQATVGANWWITQANIDGAVIGPSSSVSGNVALFSGTTGKLLQDGGTPAAFLAGTAHAATSKGTPVDADEIPVADSAASYGLKRLTWANLKATLKSYFDTLYGGLTPNVQSVASAATVTPTFSNDMVKVTAQAAALTLANPTGTAVEGWGIVLRIKDNGTARSISYGTQYRAMGVSLPGTTVVNKTTYLACVWNDTDTKLDVIAVGQEA